MSRRNSIILTSSILILVLGVGWYSSQVWIKNSKTDTPRELPDEIKPYAEQFHEIEKLQEQDPKLAREKTKELLDQIPAGPVRRWMNLALNSGIEDILFYGRVIDQYGDPVPDVRVNYEAPGKFYGTGSGFGHVLSDDAGNFTIDVHGSSVKIWGMEHPEAMYVGMLVGLTGSRLYPTSNSFYSFRQSVQSSELLWTETSAEDPFIFDIWRVDLDEAESHSQDIEWGESSIRIGHDGSPHTVKLQITKRQFQVTPGITEDGDLIVRCERDSMREKSERGDWSVTVEPIDGGIQEASDRYLNIAPETGYQPSITISERFGEESYQPSIHEQRYYFTAHNGQVFGVLFNDYRPFKLPNQPKSGEFVPQYCLITIEYKVNRAGSRYLFKDRGLLAKQ